ncbi:MAG: transcription termination factor NusA [Microgenomates group bacterium]
MTVVKSEFLLALNQVSAERNIPAEDVLQSIEEALVAAYKKEYPDAEKSETITAKIHRSTGEAHLFEEDRDITPPGFGRIAAQTAKQVILQKIREVEKKTVVQHFQSHIGSCVKGRVIRFDGYNAYFDLGKAEAILPKEEQIRQEEYAVNMSYTVYIKEIGNDKYGNPRIVVSRSDVRLIEELFKREVPEIANGSVIIKKTVREAGERAKIAVSTGHGAVDPVGACVGQRGVRVQTVTDECGGKEKIDIILWNSDTKLFIMSALSPAKVSSIELDTKARNAKVTVEESQAPLAIGKGGINVNLASRLAEYTIDIIQIPDATPSAKKETENTEAVS